MAEGTKKFTLDNGETLLWSGKPEPFEVKDSAYKDHIKKTNIISIVGYAVFLVAFLILALSRDTELGKTVVTALIVGAIPVSYIARSTSEARKIGISTYYLTDKRAVVQIKDEFKSFVIGKDTPCRVEALDNGADVLYMGAAISTKPTNARHAATVGLTDESHKVTGIAFYSIKDANEIALKSPNLVVTK